MAFDNWTVRFKKAKDFFLLDNEDPLVTNELNRRLQSKKDREQREQEKQAAKKDTQDEDTTHDAEKVEKWKNLGSVWFVLTHKENSNKSNLFMFKSKFTSFQEILHGRCK